MPEETENAAPVVNPAPVVDPPSVDPPSDPVVDPAAGPVVEAAVAEPVANAAAEPAATDAPVLDDDSAEAALEDGAIFVGVGHKITLTAPDADSYAWAKSDANENGRDEQYFKDSQTFFVSFNIPGNYAYKVNGVTEFKINVR